MNMDIEAWVQTALLVLTTIGACGVIMKRLQGVETKIVALTLSNRSTEIKGIDQKMRVMKRNEEIRKKIRGMKDWNLSIKKLQCRFKLDEATQTEVVTHDEVTPENPDTSGTCSHLAADKQVTLNINIHVKELAKGQADFSETKPQPAPRPIRTQHQSEAQEKPQAAQRPSRAQQPSEAQEKPKAAPRGLPQPPLTPRAPHVSANKSPLKIKEKASYALNDVVEELKQVRAEPTAPRGLPQPPLTPRAPPVSANKSPLRIKEKASYALNDVVEELKQKLSTMSQGDICIKPSEVRANSLPNIAGNIPAPPPMPAPIPATLPANELKPKGGRKRTRGWRRFLCGG